MGIERSRGSAARRIDHVDSRRRALHHPRHRAVRRLARRSRATRGLDAERGAPKGTAVKRIALLLLLLLIVACNRYEKAQIKEQTGGDIAQGKQLVQQYGCTACHTIP